MSQECLAAMALVEHLERTLKSSCTPDRVNLIVEQSDDSSYHEIKTTMEQIFACESTQKILIDAELNRPHD